jgi:hypothetical protein
MDMKDNDRPSRIRELERSYEDVIEHVINGTLGQKEDKNITPDEQAFMNAAKRGQARILPPVLPGEQTIENLPE